MYRNTKFFHALTATKRRKKLILKMKVGGRAITNQNMIKKEIRSFFKNIYKQSSGPQVKFQRGLVSSISKKEVNELEIFPSKEEVKEAVWSCDPSKALGSDSFNMNFIKIL